MTNEPNPDVLERNVGRMVARWGDPVSREQIEASCRTFVGRVAESGLPRARRSGLAALAAIVLVCVSTLWMVFSRQAAEMAATSGAVSRSQETPSPIRHRLEARQAEKPVAPRVTMTPVQAALCWLARHQNADGSWGAKSFAGRCTGNVCAGTGEADYDAGETALALLAFLGAGYSHLSKDEYPDVATPGTLKFGEVVKKGLQWLLAHQDREGCLGERGIKYMYNHAIGALCLAEAYGMTASQPLKEPAQKAIDFLIAGQNPGKGWRYSARCGDNDTSVTAWAALALKAAEDSELRFPKNAAEGVLAWLAEASEKGGYERTGYNARATGKVYVPGANESFHHHETMTAISVVTRIFLQRKRTDAMSLAIDQLVRDLPAWKKDDVDFYYWHFGSLAVYQLDSGQGDRWNAWNEAMKTALLRNQKPDADLCASGSWNPDDDRWGREGGRVYVTAMGALVLETYYRYSLVIGAK